MVKEAEHKETEEREKGLVAARAEKRKAVDQPEEEEVRVPCEPCKKKEWLARKEDPIYWDALLVAYFCEVVADWEEDSESEVEELENLDSESYQLSEEEGEGDEE
ncbi:hypothetical protein DAEQUDRAFT_767094 [Daedalea quercina L-15889]|uniref:Uncharacterized protein n=1 Tax=Daedalea quercina L-15889 TaxID=1314783 RepID=A0A165NYQ4_9APHY|nr:hypothetical protein DAEQUDRAFT_767094 [Daedalea quercina L-15889]